MASPNIRSCVLAFCSAVLAGHEEGEPFVTIGQQVRAFQEAPWPAAAATPEGVAERAVVEYLTAVPNHVRACTDLEYKHFHPTQPLRISDHPGHVLHLHAIMEAFSRTNPQRYGALWLPLLDLAIAAAPPGAAHLPGLHKAKAHVQGARATTVDPMRVFQGVDPNSALDGVMQNILSAFPGISGMMQQMMDMNNGGKLEDITDKVQELVGPVLKEAAAQDPQAACMQPAVHQIMQGLSDLTRALSRSSAPSAPVVQMDEDGAQ